MALPPPTATQTSDNSNTAAAASQAVQKPANPYVLMVKMLLPPMVYPSVQSIQSLSQKVIQVSFGNRDDLSAFCANLGNSNLAWSATTEANMNIVKITVDKKALLEIYTQEIGLLPIGKYKLLFFTATPSPKDPKRNDTTTDAAMAIQQPLQVILEKLQTKFAQLTAKREKEKDVDIFDTHFRKTAIVAELLNIVTATTNHVLKLEDLHNALTKALDPSTMAYKILNQETGIFLGSYNNAARFLSIPSRDTGIIATLKDCQSLTQQLLDQEFIVGPNAAHRSGAP